MDITKEYVYRSAKGNAVTNSLIVAKAFGKSHKDVIRAIKNLLAQNCADLNNWFYETTYKDRQGKVQPMVVMNRDGFTMLVMGFTGERATQFKVQFIQQFNRLTQIIRYGADVEHILGNPDVLIGVLTAYKEQQVKIQQQQLMIEAAKPAQLYYEAVAITQDTILVRELAKLLMSNGIDIGEKRLFKLLREQNYLNKNNEPTQYAMNLKLFKRTEHAIIRPDGTIRTTFTTRVTGKGQQFFLNKFLKQQQRLNS